MWGEGLGKDGVGKLGDSESCIEKEEDMSSVSKMHRLFVVLLRLLGLLLVSVAPPATAAPPATSAPPGAGVHSNPAQPVNLRLAWWGSQDRHDRTIKVIKLFEQTYPNITITYEFAGFQDYWVKMNTQAAGKSLPDVIQ